MSSAVETNLPSAMETDRLLEDDAARNETLIFNVGGIMFETYRCTLTRMQCGPLTDTAFLEAAHRPRKNDYFFDKDPDAFKIVLNYLRTGQVSIPAHIDGPYIRNELVFWGVTSDLEVTTSGESSRPCATTAVQSLDSHANRNVLYKNGTGNKIWNILSIPESSMLAKIYAGISYCFMFLSVVILVAESTPLLQEVPTDEETFTSEPPEPKEPDVLIGAIIVSIACCLFFTVEYILRIIFAPNKKLFVLSFLGVIDFMAILPNLLALLIDLFVGNFTSIAMSLSVLRILRVVRILRLLRIFKHFKVMLGTDVIVHTIKSCFGQVMCLFFSTSILVLLWGTLAYAIDFSGEFDNIPLACWWVIVTMTTVGYGDIVPFTVGGKVLASFCTLSGLLMIGLLVSVIVTSMVDSSKKMQNTRRKTTLKN